MSSSMILFLQAIDAKEGTMSLKGVFLNCSNGVLNTILFWVFATRLKNACKIMVKT